MASQPEYISDESPAPSSVKDAKGPISEAFVEEVFLPPFFPEFKEKLKSLPPFWRDTKLHLKIRSYYFYRDIAETTKNEAWALGGSLDYRSGWWKDRFQIGAVGYTSQKLYGPDDKDGTLLLKNGQDGFSILGQSFLNTRIYEGVNLRLFRQTFNLPYVNRQDSRMVPNTFEAYTLGGRSIYNTDFIVGHITKMKTRNSTDFQYMSEVAGLPGTNEGLTMGGARYSFSEDINIGAINSYAWDLWNTLYGEANGIWELTDRTAFLLSGQYTSQWSVGEELDGDFNTFVFGGKAALSYRGGILSLAFSSTDHDSGIRSPFGDYPGYLSLMLKDFNRADEDAWLVGLSYDFGFVGIDGLSFFANYAGGNTPDSGLSASPDQEEFDLTVDYRFEKGPLRGLWLRFRSAFVDQDGPDAQDIDHFRIILNYDIPIF
jgi:hypothetical protein